MNLAALSALVRGDIDNFLVASAPGGIVAQEAAGQAKLVASSQIPKKGCDRSEFKKIGFVFGEDVDDLFVAVQMPPGWSIRPTEHSMHSDLLDEKGRKRAGIFYKAAFYDRSASITLSRRYQINMYDPCNADGSAAEYGKHSHIRTSVCDGERVIYAVGVCKDRDYATSDKNEALAREWLDKNFPLWNDPMAYWD